jgi:hypothetical protein
MTTEPAMTSAAPRTGPLPVTVLCGFLGSGKPGEGKRFNAVRLFITNCATDARPVSTLIEAEEVPRVPELTWLKVTGIATSPILNGKRTTIIRAASVQPTRAHPHDAKRRGRHLQRPGLARSGAARSRPSQPPHLLRRIRPASPLPRSGGPRLLPHLSSEQNQNNNNNYRVHK